MRLHASRESVTIAVRTLLYDNRNVHSPVGVRVRTNGRATLGIRKDRALKPYQRR